MQLKQSVWLARLELKHSILNLVLSWIVLTAFSTLILYEIAMKYSQGEGGLQYDLIFCFVLGLAPYWFRNKHFQYNKQSNNVWASPTLIMQSILPVPKKALFQSRMIIYFAYYLPAAITALIVTYAISADMRALMVPTAYLIFALIWMSLNVCTGMVLAASDVGDHITVRTMTVAILILAGIIGLIYILFYILVKEGLLYHIIHTATHDGWIALICCALALTASFQYWPYYMNKKMKQLDYF